MARALWRHSGDGGAYRPDLDPETRLHTLAQLENVTLAPTAGIRAVLALFDEHAADEIDGVGHVQGVITERHARRRYLEEIDAAQRSAFSD
jgi:CIC family chloride channel protein